MVLTNAQRQALYRERRKAEALGHINRYGEKIARAREAIARIDAGMTHHTASGNEPMRDCTAEYRAEKEDQIKMYEGFARIWERGSAEGAE